MHLCTLLLFVADETDIDSEIFRYNIHSGKFSLYQKLRTHAAVDIKYFCFESNEKTEGFLVVANNYRKGKNILNLFNMKEVFNFVRE